MIKKSIPKNHLSSSCSNQRFSVQQANPILGSEQTIEILIVFAMVLFLG